MIGALIYGDRRRSSPAPGRATVLRGPHGRLRIIESGDDDGVHAILVHGTPGRADGWSGSLAAPPSGVRLTAFDRPGFGASAPRRAVPSLEHQAAAIAPILDRSRGPVIVVGHSLGAPIACLAALRWPDRVAGIVLAAGAMDPELEGRRWFNHAGRIAGPIAGRSLRNANREIWTLQAELVALASVLPTVRAHVHILHGVQDRLALVGNATYAADRLPAAASLRTQLLPDAGHFLPWRQRLELHAAIADMAAIVGGGTTDPPVRTPAHGTSAIPTRSSDAG